MPKIYNAHDRKNFEMRYSRPQCYSCYELVGHVTKRTGGSSDENADEVATNTIVFGFLP